MPVHDSRGSRQRRATGIFKVISGGKHGLFADDAIASNFLDLTEFIRDVPIAAFQLNRLGALVFDADMISPNKTMFVWLAMVI